jgi:hypothetical protein
VRQGHQESLIELQAMQLELADKARARERLFKSLRFVHPDDTDGLAHWQHLGKIV